MKYRTYGRRHLLASSCIAVLFTLPIASADAQSQKSLNGCQMTVAKEATKYASALTETVGRCLQSASTKVLARKGSAGDAATVCVAQLAKLVNTAAPARALAAKFDSAVDKACDPSVNSRLSHLESDIYSVGFATLSAGNLGAYCRAFGGDSTVNSYAEWRTCLRAASECEARQSLAARYPRALEYMEVLRTAIGALPSSSKQVDALTALDAIDRAMDGRTEDNVPEIGCGPSLGICGNGAAETGEMCDGADLNGETCVSLGFVGGALSCNGCLFDTAACTGERVPATGQSVSNGAHSDGSVRAGPAQSYTDNGDGTITDNNTGLMWEKKANTGVGDVHSVSGTYTWCEDVAPMDILCDDPSRPMDGSIVTFLETLNDVAGAGANCFAGHCDWRIPNVRELASILDLSRDRPATDVAFHDAVACQSCSDITTCSCTVAIGNGYWTSSDGEAGGTGAWAVSFIEGFVYAQGKGVAQSVRAVRTVP